MVAYVDGINAILRNNGDHPPSTRMEEVRSFKQNFDMKSFLEICSSNGFAEKLRGITDMNKRLDEFIEFYWRSSTGLKVDVNFAGFVVNSFQRETGIDLGMCKYLVVNLGESSYVKDCFSQGSPRRTFCTGFRWDSCPSYSKHL